MLPRPVVADDADLLPAQVPACLGYVERVFFCEGQCFAEFSDAGLCVLAFDGSWSKVRVQ